MRLLTKTFLYYIFLSAVVFILGGIVFYFLTGRIFYKQVDEGLITEKDIIAEEIETTENIPDYSSRFGHQIEVVLLNHPKLPEFSISDTVIQNDKTEERYRYLYFCQNRSKGRAYTIKIFHPIDETSDLIKGILLVMFIMFTCLFILLIVINFSISKNIWVPFYNTIYRLNQYNINEKETFIFPETNIHEFNILNNVISSMSERIKMDFLNMKEFIENASHEIQTPLAIIKSKIEILLQTKKLNNHQIEALQVINDSVHRLSKLNSGLILLSKIDNMQYPQIKLNNITMLTEKLLEEFEELIQMKELSVTSEVIQPFELTLNPALCEILIGNLLSNAIKHNVHNGFIEIKSERNSLIIRNSGLPLTVPEAELFSRFKKNNPDSKSLGLGLALIKKICDVYKIAYSYSCTNSIHTFTLGQKN